MPPPRPSFAPLASRTLLRNRPLWRAFSSSSSSASLHPRPVAAVFRLRSFPAPFPPAPHRHFERSEKSLFALHRPAQRDPHPIAHASTRAVICAFCIPGASPGPTGASALLLTRSGGTSLPPLRPVHPTVISNEASRRLSLPFHSCEMVGLRREKSLFIFLLCDHVRPIVHDSCKARNLS
jgi:hypothetical protein